MTTYTYDFEAGDEGGTITGTGSYVTFDDWITPSQGRDDIYTWELRNVQYYEVVQSINGYSTLTFVEVLNEDIPNPGEYAKRVALQRLDLDESIYDKKLFRGEIR